MNLSDLQITDEDIERLEQRWAQRLARPVGFNEERRTVLKHMGTCDVQACPGSGKTTTLTAKLELLLEKWPDSAQGICVLSHTNGARDEVVKKLGRTGELLLRRPHFIGTIQHFVNHFLATPEVVARFGSRPWAFDDAAHYVMMRRKFAGLNGRRQAYYRRLALSDDGAQYLSHLTHSFDDPDVIKFWRDDKEFEIGLSQTSDVFQELKRIKAEVAQDGCFSFHDAYSLGNAYLTRHPEISDILSKRFPIVFIDEMQDTDQFQVELLKKVFEGKAVVQRFGDKNQSIFSTGLTDAEVERPWEAETSLNISTTHRLSASIAKLAEGMGIHPHQLSSVSGTDDLQHTIFVFTNPGAVLQAYAELIAENNLAGPEFWAVAAVGKPQEADLKFTLQSYHSPYTASQQRTRQNNFQAFWNEALKLYQDYGYTGKSFDLLFAAFVQMSRELQLKRSDDPLDRLHSATSLRKALLPQQKTVRGLLLKWLRLLSEGQQPTPAEVEADVLPLLFPEQRPTSLTSFRQFLRRTEPQTPNEPPENQNRFKVTINDRELEIALGTIHSVKGQTHTSTLLLESFWHASDLEDLKPYLVNERPRKTKARTAKRMKLAYVAMTRPTHLLCLAIHSSRLNAEEQDKLTNLGWRIRIIG